jgi:integrase/recombinase XerD
MAENPNYSLDVKAAELTFAGRPFPRLIADAGRSAIRRFVEFFTANIRNLNTRAAYAQAVGQFCEWTEAHGLSLEQLNPVLVSVYIEELTRRRSAPTVKQHLAAIRMLFDWLVIGQIVPMNPVASVRGPSYVTKRGKTPVLTAEEARALLDSISVKEVIGLRDRALIGVMLYTFSRVSAAAGMNLGDYYSIGKRSWIRLHEKGGKLHEVPAHHNAVLYLDEYIAAAGIDGSPNKPIFRSARGRTGLLGENRMHRVDALRMIKRRAKAAGIEAPIGCHTFRGTGITAYLSNGGILEKAQAIANHESARTTKLYDRRDDELTLDEIERISV